MTSKAFLVRLADAVRLLFGFQYLLNGVNWWWKLLPYPSINDPRLAQTPAFVQAMIDTGYMFDGIKVVEVLAGIALLANRWVPLTLIIALPVTVGIWSVNYFLIPDVLRAQIMGWSALLMIVFLALAYFRYYLPFLRAKAEPFLPGLQQGAGVDVLPIVGLPAAALITLGIVAAALGAVADAILVKMMLGW